jgi:hypothetical protein
MMWRAIPFTSDEAYYLHRKVSQAAARHMRSLQYTGTLDDTKGRGLPPDDPTSI